MSFGSELIYENFAGYLTENKKDMSHFSGAMEMLHSDGAFRAYIDHLTEGVEDPKLRTNLKKIADRQRLFLLQESANNISPTSSAIGYWVTYFPILMDVYSNPVINSIATLQTVNKSVLTIPRVRTIAKTLNLNGTVTTNYIPRNRTLTRPTDITLDVLSADNGKSIMTILNAIGGGLTYPSSVINFETFRINKTFTYVSNIVVNNGTADTDIPVTLVCDARGQFKSKLTFTDGPDTVTVDIFGNINFDNGAIQFNALFSTTGAGTYTLTKVVLKIKLSPKTSKLGRTTVDIESQGRDVEIDVREEFEIPLLTETIQDYKDIYNIDMIRHLSDAIKSQMLLNKDIDLSNYLQAYEPVMTSYSASSTIDFNDYKTAGGDYTPRTPIDVFKTVVPHITGIAKNIFMNYRMMPNMLICGMGAGSLLQSLQEYVFINPGMTSGQSGYASPERAISFGQMQIFTTPAIPEHKIYLVTKPASDDLARSVIIDLVYQPLYVIEEIQNSIRRTFIKSRTTFEVVSPEGLGVVTLSNYNDVIPASPTIVL